MGYQARATQRSGRNRLGPRREFRNGAVSRQSAEKLGPVTDERFSCCCWICSAFPFSSSICAAFLFSQFHLSSGATPSIRGRGSAPGAAALFVLFFFLLWRLFSRGLSRSCLSPPCSSRLQFHACHSRSVQHPDA
ncbi:hypothetical protein EJF18_60186 [Clavispora lusitaniae]|uniref:Uncharacterized protein n=1 Tax=Clavispora lusitaniae TaxID=36911 RepID=A0ACD0WQ76_CLALS|nr:hypothetical protein EJF14_60186 [Clavispora lusitaniae]QFZ35324.1 hypothetical protein EJF16_60186 [Clavispora lusitaniae]QFZ41018.1 hypothetical protein EJF15_60186 [Clavispora lusitaniae]QFZ46699.1 hypothetical protein EJF18_60186 [Clavispora lusitaniae]QFZ52364.1 hypothetical protein EJF17_60186 [Clavispora lusitaniae]